MRYRTAVVLGETSIQIPSASSVMCAVQRFAMQDVNIKIFMHGNHSSWATSPRMACQAVVLSEKVSKRHRKVTSAYALRDSGVTAPTFAALKRRLVVEEGLVPKERLTRPGSANAENRNTAGESPEPLATHQTDIKKRACGVRLLFDTPGRVS